LLAVFLLVLFPIWRKISAYKSNTGKL